MGQCGRVVQRGRECLQDEQVEYAQDTPLIPCLQPTYLFCADKEAGQAFEKAASIQTKNLNEPEDAANTWVEAFKVYRKSDPVDAARCLDIAINFWTSKGNFRRAATHKQNLGEVYEKEIGDLPKAMESYELAASWFESDNAEAYVHYPRCCKS